MSDINLPFEESPTPRPAKRLSLSSIVLLVGILVAIAVIGLQLARRQQTQPTDGTAPDFAITTFDGQELSLENLRGQIVVLNFWASWCDPCREEAPDLQRIHERYQDQGVVVVGVTYTDTDAKSLAFMEAYGLTYPNGPDRGNRISDRYNIQGVPETFVIDREGKIAHFIYAPTNEQTLATMLDGLLNEA
jgi:cytochrome c biogenesis protein CcmG/thiol:disulfide interchange protein DsbE